MTEADLKGGLMHIARSYLGPRYVMIRHEDATRSGVPDISSTGAGWTAWWEGKIVKGNSMVSTGIQDLTMLRLDRAGFARYLLWEDSGDYKRVYIARPRDVVNMDGTHNDVWRSTSEMAYARSWAEVHKMTAQHIHKIHALGSRRAAFE
jgi:hypothetical protein